MVETVAAVGSTLMSALPEIGAGLGSSAGGTAASTMASAVQGGMTLMSAITSLGGAFSADRHGLLGKKSAYIDGEGASIQLLSQLNENLAQRLVAGAASGTDTTGSPTYAAESLVADGTRARGFITRDTGIRALQALMGGNAAGGQAAMQAVSQLANFGMDVMGRGGPSAAAPSSSSATRGFNPRTSTFGGI